MKKYYLISLVSILLISCGKSIKDSGPSTNSKERVLEEVSIDAGVKNFLELQNLECTEDKCPESLAQVFVMDKDEVKTCSGILIEDNKVLTSASCLDRELKVPYISCSENVFTVFARNGAAKQTYTGCKRITVVDNNIERNPELWERDIAILELDRVVPRKAISINDKGLSDGQLLTTWGIRKTAKYKSRIEKTQCQVLLNTYLNPYSTHSDSPMAVVTGCDLKKGVVGAPMLVGESLYAIYSKEMSEFRYRYFQRSNLVIGDLKQYFHVTNASCVYKDCMLITSTEDTDILRAKMLANKEIHTSNIVRLKREANINNKYFMHTLDFLPTETGFQAHLGRPLCVLNSNNWIGEFTTRWRRNIYVKGFVSYSIPNMVLQTKLNSDLKAVSHLNVDGQKKFNIEFNPYGAHVQANTYVKIDAEFLGRGVSDRYENIGKCN